MVDHDLMMHHITVELQEQAGGGVVNDGRFHGLAGKLSNRLERVPPGHHGDVDRAVPLVLEECHTLITVDGRQFGHYGRLQVAGVLGGMLACGARLPDARDHGCAAPMTTFHGRTDQRFTSPPVTYGSASANRSTTSLL